MGEEHSWARTQAESVHNFYAKAAEWLEEHFEAAVSDMRWFGSGEYLMIELHLFALQSLRQHRKENPRDAHINLPEYLRFVDPEEFALVFWTAKDPMIGQLAQKIVNSQDDGAPLYRSVRVADMILKNYGQAWLDLPDTEFNEAWEWNWLVDADEPPRITWDGA